MSTHSRVKVGVLNLEREVNALIKTYGDAVTDAMLKKVLPEVGKDTVTMLKNTSPERTGKYARDWALDNVQVLRGTFAKTVVYNKKHYRLTHLLEFPHAKRGGGRTSEGHGQETHIYPAQEYAEHRLMELAEMELNRVE